MNSESNPAALLNELRAFGTPDMIWTGHDGERYWFKAMESRHAGRTECCYAETNIDVRTGTICARHRAMAGKPATTVRERFLNLVTRIWWSIRPPLPASRDDE